ncbi:MAG: peptide chain release factor N(5)-glutamine methyltransferase [Bacteroidales bacterium]|nr:peptide chain release factor N(5)-glutamine methyltransferase [Bacteroidales bacterium]
MTIGEFVAYFQSKLASLEWYDSREVRSMASYLLKEIAGVESYKLIVEPQLELRAEDAEALVGAADKISQGVPLQYALGYEYFCGHKFKVAPGVLIPRPETEELVNLIFADNISKPVSSTVPNDSVAESPKLHILDICTGSGCIAWSLAAGIQGSSVYGCDISEEALAIARSQEIEGLASRQQVSLSLFKCDIMDISAPSLIWREVCGKMAQRSSRSGGTGGFDGFDIIVSNPPYVCEEERAQMRVNVLEHEPELALFVPDDDPLRFYRQIAWLSGGGFESGGEKGTEKRIAEKPLLKKGGMLYFEVNERFAHEVAATMRDAGFVECQVVCDMFGKERIVKGRRM